MPAEVTVGGRVWNDANGDGQLNSGESGVRDVIVQLFDADSNFVALALTDTSGSYTLTETIGTSSYQVVFSTSNRFIFTRANEGDDASDSDADSDGLTGLYPTASGGELTINAGLIWLPDDTSYVWLDVNGNELQDIDEPGISGATVRLYDSSLLRPSTDITLYSGAVPLSPALVVAAVTDSSGKYSVGAVLSNRGYFLEFELPNEHYRFISPVPPNLLDSNNDADPAAASPSDSTGSLPFIGRAPQTGLFSVSDTHIGPVFDAGVQVAVGNRVWEDLNLDGNQDPGEPGLEDIDLNLRTAAGIVVQSTTSNKDGYFGFAGVPPGDYWIEAILPVGYSFTVPRAGSPSDDSDITTVTLPSGRTDTFTLTASSNDLDRDVGVIGP